MTTNELETPSNADLELYEFRGEDVDPARPVFTGDVYELDGGLVMLVQHPCAMRSGPQLHEQLLVIGVGRPAKALRSNWKNAPLTQMPLPNMLSECDHEGNFLDLRMVKSSQLTESSRVVILSQKGVNLLMQRWVFHNTRVLIPTLRFDEQISGKYAEAELAADWCNGRDVEPHIALQEFEDFIRSSPGDGRTFQQMLDSGQERSTVRKAMRARLQELTDQ